MRSHVLDRSDFVEVRLCSMTGFALTLVLLSAVIHATWNLLAKRAAGGLPFQWLFTVLSALIYVPVALVIELTHPLRSGSNALIFIAGAALLQLVYFLLLTQGYRVGDLSLVYPLARGSGALLATIAAIALRGERPTGLALAGTVGIGVGAFLLTGDPRALRRSGSGKAVTFALLTGLLIATYTLWDKQAVSNAQLPPVLYYWVVICGQAVLLAPLALQANQRKALSIVWRRYWREALGVAALSPLAYFLVLTALTFSPVLTALTFSPVSYVSPTREIGILIGAVMGSRLLGEGDVRQRLVAAGIMVLGLLALALG